MLFQSLLVVFICLAGLWYGSQLLISGALDLSKKSGLTQSFIGATVLSVCTNLPEIMVSFSAAFQQWQGVDSAGLALGNVVGSSVSQVSLVIGLAGFASALKVNKKELLKHGTMLIVSTMLLLLFASDGFISRAQGLILVLFYLIYFSTLNPSTTQSMLRAKLSKFNQTERLSSIILIILGLVLTVLSSHFLVAQVLELTQVLRIDQTLLGIFLVGLGISLPELFVIGGSLKKNAAALSLGTLLGSNVVGILLAIGGSAAWVGWTVDRQVALFDIPFLLLSTVIAILFLLTRGKLDRKESFLLLTIYGLYAALKALGF